MSPNELERGMVVEIVYTELGYATRHIIWSIGYFLSLEGDIIPDPDFIITLDERPGGVLRQMPHSLADMGLRPYEMGGWNMSNYTRRAAR